MTLIIEEKIGVILINLSNHKVVGEPNERIAQMVISKHEQAVWKETESLKNSVKCRVHGIRKKIKNMKIIVPMAGRGSRLRPHALTTPKPLISISGKPIVQGLSKILRKHIMKKLKK